MLGLVNGSDCPSGKQQYATKEHARQAAGAGQVRGWATNAYRCLMCECWHIGNRRGNESRKSRHRR